MGWVANLKSSPFMKRVLIPFWLVQLAFVLYFFRLYIWLVTIIDKYGNSADDEGEYDNYGIPVVVYLLIVVCLIGFMLLLAEMILFFCGKLKPITYFVFQSVQTFIWLGMLVAQVINGVEVNPEDGPPDATGSIAMGAMRYVGISTALFFAFVATLIYASVIFHRHRRGKRLPNRDSTTRTALLDVQPPEREVLDLENQRTHPLGPIDPLRAHASYVVAATPPHTHDGGIAVEDMPSEVAIKARSTTAIDTLSEPPIRPPLPPYFERLSTTVGAQVRHEGREVYELAAIRNGRRGGIAVH